MDNIRTDYVNKLREWGGENQAVLLNIEDLSVSGMMKNRQLSKAVALQKFYDFRIKLKEKCEENGSP